MELYDPLKSNEYPEISEDWLRDIPHLAFVDDYRAAPAYLQQNKGIQVAFAPKLELPDRDWAELCEQLAEEAQRKDADKTVTNDLIIGVCSDRLTFVNPFSDRTTPDQQDPSNLNAREFLTRFPSGQELLDSLDDVFKAFPHALTAEIRYHTENNLPDYLLQDIPPAFHQDHSDMANASPNLKHHYFGMAIPLCGAPMLLLNQVGPDREVPHIVEDFNPQDVFWASDEKMPVYKRTLALHTHPRLKFPISGDYDLPRLVVFISGFMPEEE
jgi:hypothetical protein